MGWQRAGLYGYWVLGVGGFDDGINQPGRGHGMTEPGQGGEDISPRTSHSLRHGCGAWAPPRTGAHVTRLGLQQCPKE
jgi:hypothetical protein